MTLAEPPDTRQGWCCDGRTWKEHTDADGHCCQPEGRQLEELPQDGQQKAKERLGPGEVADRCVLARWADASSRAWAPAAAQLAAAAAAARPAGTDCTGREVGASAHRRLGVHG